MVLQVDRVEKKTFGMLALISLGGQKLGQCPPPHCLKLITCFFTLLTLKERLEDWWDG